MWRRYTVKQESTSTKSHSQGERVTVVESHCGLPSQFQWDAVVIASVQMAARAASCWQEPDVLNLSLQSEQRKRDHFCCEIPKMSAACTNRCLRDFLVDMFISYNVLKSCKSFHGASAASLHIIHHLQYTWVTNVANSWIFYIWWGVVIVPTDSLLNALLSKCDLQSVDYFRHPTSFKHGTWAMEMDCSIWSI